MKKMMWKKMILVGVCLTAVFAISACGKNNDEIKNPTVTPAVTEPAAPERDETADGYIDPNKDPVVVDKNDADAQKKDYLTEQVDKLTAYFTENVDAYYLGKLAMPNGERHMFLSRVGTNAETRNAYLDITSALGVSSETIMLTDASGKEQSTVESILTNYGVLYICDFQTTPDINNLQFIHVLKTDNDLVNIAMKTFRVPIANMTEDITALNRLQEGSLDIYKLSGTLYAVPENAQAVFEKRETSTQEDGSTVRVNYSENNNFVVWGSGEVPATATLSNTLSNKYPHYKINQPSIFQSPVMPYVYTITYSYDEGVITAAMDGSTEYLTDRDAYEDAFVLNWGMSKIV